MTGRRRSSARSPLAARMTSKSFAGPTAHHGASRTRPGRCSRRAGPPPRTDRDLSSARSARTGLAAPCVFDAAINSARILAYVDQASFDLFDQVARLAEQSPKQAAACYPLGTVTSVLEGVLIARLRPAAARAAVHPATAPTPYRGRPARPPAPGSGMAAWAQVHG